MIASSVPLFFPLNYCQVIAEGQFLFFLSMKQHPVGQQCVCVRYLVSVSLTSSTFNSEALQCISIISSLLHPYISYVYVCLLVCMYVYLCVCKKNNVEKIRISYKKKGSSHYRPKLVSTSWCNGLN